jgi:hypothetical protein
MCVFPLTVRHTVLTQLSKELFDLRHPNIRSKPATVSHSKPAESSTTLKHSTLAYRTNPKLYLPISSTMRA